MADSEHISMDDILYIDKLHSERHVFRISWKMTNSCPYSCSYCYMHDAVEKARICRDDPAQEDAEEIASHFDEMIEKLSGKGELIQLHIIGGEVSQFDLVRVIGKIRSARLRQIIVATNLYRNEDYWRRLKDYCAGRGIKVKYIASFHLEMLRTEEERKRFIDKAMLLGAQVKAVVNDSNLKEYLPYFSRLASAGCEIEITVERQKENSCRGLSDENQRIVDGIRHYQFAIRKEKIQEYRPYYIVTLKDGRKISYSSNIALIDSIKEGALDPTGFWCTAGMHNVRINKSGELLRSACRLCSMYFKNGNIRNPESYKKITEPIVCKTTEAGKDHKYLTKYCTCFNNTSMCRIGYNPETGAYDKDCAVEIPDYHKMRYGGSE